MSYPKNEPLVDMRRVLPLGPATQAVVPGGNRGVVPFGVRYAVPSVVGSRFREQEPADQAEGLDQRTHFPGWRAGEGDEN